MSNKKMSLCLLFFFCFLLPACSVQKALSNQETLRFDLTSTPTFHLANRVVRGDAVVMVHPNMNLEAMPTALFVPLGATQVAQNSDEISHGISRVIWQQFLEAQTFSVLEYANTPPPYRTELALPYARSKKADLLIGGYITYYIDGGKVGNTRVSIILEVYDVKNGNMLWSIAHAGELPYEKTRDYIIAEVKTSMPFDPSYVVTAALGMDIARLLKMWTTPKQYAPESTRKAF